jgi:hypothetical protein
MTFTTIADPTLVNKLDHPQEPPSTSDGHAASDKATARALLTAIRTRPATPAERQALARFPGCGPVALRLFPDPVTGRYKDATWQTLGEELCALLTPEEYASAKRTTFTAFYTAPVVVQAMHAALAPLGVPHNALVLEPGCGIGNFMAQALAGMRFLGVELDPLSGRIARTLYPDHDIRIEHFRDTRLPAGSIDAVLGNVPFADLRLDYAGLRLALHDFFLAKSLDTLIPGGVLALVTSHYTLDKQHTGLREHLAHHADFLGALRLPSTAFQQEGTTVVTDILCLRKRAPGEAPHHTDPAWLETAPYTIEGVDIPINRYFLHHPAMVLGTWSRAHRLYASADTYGLRATGDLGTALRAATAHLPQGVWSAYARTVTVQTTPVASPLAHLTEGRFFVDETGTIHQIMDGQSVPVTHGATPLTATSPRMGRRLAALIALRDQARQVLHAQNDGWPETQRQAARHALSRLYDGFVATYGPINTTTLSTTDDGTTIRRLPNLVKFRDDPDAMLVMALEHYDESTGMAAALAHRHRRAGVQAQRPGRHCHRPLAAHHPDAWHAAHFRRSRGPPHALGLRGVR